MTALDKLTAEYQAEITKRGLMPMSADELLVELMSEKDSKPKDITFMQDFLRRWQDAAETASDQPIEEN